jgi:ketosteroid isomerase-like protein
LSVLRGIVAAMTATARRPPAVDPNDLGRYFVERVNAGDVEGLVALYEPGAVLAFPSGTVAAGHAEIRQVYEEFLASGPVLAAGHQRPALVAGSLALTSTELTTGAVTVEIAHRQPDGYWLWAVDQPTLP